MGWHSPHLECQHAHRRPDRATPLETFRARTTGPGPDVRTMWGNSHDRQNRGPPHPSTQRPGKVHRPGEAAMGTDHGRPQTHNADPLPYVPYGYPVWTPTQKHGITFTDRNNLMMLESWVR